MMGSKKLRKAVFILSAVIVLGSTGAVFAAAYKTPADIVSGLTGKTVEDLNKEREAGKTYGTIANEAGKLDEFKAQMLEQKKAVLDQRVKDGTLTKERADEIYNSIKANQASCDGTGSARIGMNSGAGFGSGACGMNNGQGLGRGAGRGMGRGLNR